MDIHPWTRYEIARMRDEERLLRARAAMQAREVRASSADDIGVEARSSSLFGWLRRREASAEQQTVRARLV
jgi:hypothetical protein